MARQKQPEKDKKDTRISFRQIRGLALKFVVIRAMFCRIVSLFHFVNFFDQNGGSVVEENRNLSTFKNKGHAIKMVDVNLAD